MKQLVLPLPSRAGGVIGPVLTGLLYYAASYVSLALTQGPFGVATVWPASGVLLAGMLASAPRIGGYAVAGAIASFATNLLAGGDVRIGIAFTIGNVAEAVIATMLLRRRLCGQPVSFVEPHHLGDFCLMSAVAAMVSAGLAAAISGRLDIAFLYSWFATDLLGMLIVTPVLLILRDALATGAGSRMCHGVRARLGETVGVAALLVGVTALTFAQSSYPILFLPMATMLIAVVRLGAPGAAMGVLIIAAIGTGTTAFHHGPAMLPDGGETHHVVFLQFYLLTLVASALPVAALLSQRERLIEELAGKNRLLVYAETAASLGHWRLDLLTNNLFLSEETLRIMGLAADATLDLAGGIDFHHPEDRDRVREIVIDAVSNCRSYEYRARLLRPDGGIRHVLARGECEVERDGRPVALFGMLQDVTRQAEDARSLEEARFTAEQAALAARAIADTDALTGLPSRRKALRVLEAALGEAEQARTPLSIGLLDVDLFKNINDHLGHVTGDAVLRHIARNVSAALRGSDLVGRYGGEEFLLVLPNASLAIAETVAERVRAGIEQSRPDVLRGTPVTVSVGIGTLRPDESLDDLLRRTDAALYEAKRAGRNRVCAAPASDDDAAEPAFADRHPVRH